MMKRIKLPILFIASVLLFQFSANTLQVFALKDALFYSQNNILFSDPDAVDCGVGTTTASTDTTSVVVTKTGTTDTIYTFLTETALSTNNNKPLSAAQAAGIMGNMSAESSLNPSSIESTSRADKGHGLVQWTFGRWTNLQNFASQKGTAWDNVTTQLEFLKTELEGSEKRLFSDSEFTSATEPSIAAMRFRVVFERADPTVAHDDKREGAAIAFYKLYGGTNTDANCTSGNGIVAGDLVKTAIGFALTSPAKNGAVNKEDARDTYQVAKLQYNPSVSWTDCGGFIATAMYASGVDKNFPNVSTDAQTAYVRSHPEKYIINEHPVLGDLQPGDILYVSGHVTMYTGQEGYPSVDASLGERVPSVRESSSATWMITNGAISARVIK